jgi:hypothetical protein
VPNTHYSVENFAGTPPAGHTITQTQAIGINNKNVPVIVGFWADQNGLNFGWEDVKGVFTTILDPNATFAGNWADKNGIDHGFFGPLGGTLKSFEVRIENKGGARQEHTSPRLQQ